MISWSLLKEEQNDFSFQPKTKTSILIPCRNEEENILSLLNDLNDQSYPNSLFDVIVIDDFSSDSTVERVKSFKGDISLRLLELTDNYIEANSSKKTALTFGVMQSQSELIITVDADCRMNTFWLASMVQFYEQSGKRIFSAPIIYDPVQGMISTFEALDFAGMMIITGGMHRARLGLLCNGANLAFEKTSFEAVDGYTGKDKMVSGDDMFLMEKIENRFPKSSAFLKSKNAIVKTKSQGSWKRFINQRTRWASKNHQYDSLIMPIQLIVPVLFNWSLFVGLVLGIFDIIPLHYLWWPLILKLLSDLLLQITATSYFERLNWLVFFPIAEILHIAYLIQVSVRSLFGRFSWKGRNY